MRNISLLALVVLFLCSGCGGPKTSCKSNAELSPTQLKTAENMVKDVYQKVLEGKGKIVAYYDEELYIMPDGNGDFANAVSKNAKKLEKPIHTISAVHLPVLNLTVSDIEPLVQAVACETQENGKKRKYKIVDWRILIEPGMGGGGLGGELDKLTIIPVTVEITDLGGKSSSKPTQIPVKTTGSKGETLSDGLVGICLDTTTEGIFNNPVIGSSTPVINIQFTLDNLTDSSISFDKIEVTFHAANRQYSKCVIVQYGADGDYSCYYLPPYHEATTPFNLEVSESATFHCGTGNDRIVHGRNRVVIKVFSGKTLVHGPYNIDFSI